MIDRHPLTTLAPVLVIFIAFFVLPDKVRSATFADYHRRVDKARALVQEISDDLDIGARNNGIQQKSTQISKLIPASESIDWPGGSFETGNQWLPEMLDEFQAEAATANGEVIIDSIGQRLEAISAAMDDLEKAIAAERTKDEDKQKLSEILSRPEYQKPAEPEESLFQKIIRKLGQWLESLIPKPSFSPDLGSGGGSLTTVLQILIYMAVIGLLGFLVYKFAPMIGTRFGGKGREKKKDRVILGERVSADESAGDLLADAERLARDGRLREAIRKGYIAVLCDLADRKLIGLARYKTNRDYLRDIRKRNDLFEHVSGLTGTYERNWYGLRPSTMPDWEEFRDRYREMMAKV